MAEKKQYGSVTELLRDVAPNDEFVAEFEEHIARRALVKKLLALRAVKGFAQKDIAEKMNCSQSRISKLENGVDDDLRLGDLLRYCDALGFQFGAVISRKNISAVDQIKHHAFCIKDVLDHLVGLADGDEAMTKGVSSLVVETLFNLVKLVADSAAELPRTLKTESHDVHIETMVPAMLGNDLETDDSDTKDAEHPATA